MLKNKNKKIYIILLAIIFLFKTSNFIDNNVLVKKIQPGSKYDSSCVIKAASSSGSIEVSPQNKKIWVGTLSFIPPVFLFIKFDNQQLICLLLCLLIIFDHRGNILKLISIYFNGSKYKGGDLLSAF